MDMSKLPPLALASMCAATNDEEMESFKSNPKLKKGDLCFRIDTGETYMYTIKGGIGTWVVVYVASREIFRWYMAINMVYHCYISYGESKKYVDMIELVELAKKDYQYLIDEHFEIVEKFHELEGRIRTFTCVSFKIMEKPNEQYKPLYPNKEEKVDGDK